MGLDKALVSARASVFLNSKVAKDPTAPDRLVHSNRASQGGWALLLWGSCMALCCLLAPVGAVAAEPIKLHPDNPHYFLFRGRPTVLITSGEHYGAVLNLDFDFVRYLDVLQAHSYNLTRTFSGTYREVPGSFGITGNTLAPSAGRYLCPWSRSSTPGAATGGNKFDLTKWDQAYFDRLKDFCAQAGKRGIVVELVFFSTMYDDKVWQASPMNTRNNINGIGNVGRHEVYSGQDKQLLTLQQAVVQKIVRELKDFDNIYYEVCNEPYERAGLSKEWNDEIIAAIVDAEAPLPAKHLIAQNLAQGSVKASDLNKHVSILNFHAASVDSVKLNYGLNKVIANDETGGSDHSDRKYRTEGWNFILAGGGVYDHLDFSYTPDREDGMAVPLPKGMPGGGGPKLRKQLQILKEFVEGFDFIKMAPNESVIKEKQVRGALAGTRPEAKAMVSALAQLGRAYAIYVNGGIQAELVLDLPAGTYQIEWINTKTGKVDLAETSSHAGGNRTLISPAYLEDIALRVKRVNDSER
ncbi:MAG TPA: hypothetical protein VFS12_16875 [Terriglobia bacterium]|nr:hypothetical protein [Terriglobia bacterium]